MERSHIIAIAGAAVFVLYVGFQLFGGSGELDEAMPLARARGGAERGSDASGGSDYSGRGESNDGRSASSSRGSEGSRSRTGGSGVSSRGEGGSRRDASTGGTRLSQTLASRAERRAAGSAGAGTRAGGAAGGGSGVFDRTGSRQLEGGGAPHRSDVVEHLASQPSSASGRAADNDDDEGENGDVALQLKRPEDTEGAGVKKDVEAPDQSDEGLTFTEGSQLAFPDGGNLNGEAGTISFEIEPNWNGNDETNNSLVTLRSEHGWSNRIELVKNGRYLRFILADNVGREADISVPIDSWVPGEAHDVKATWANGRTELYIDDVKVGENSYTEFIRPDAPLYIGSDHRGSSYSGLNGTVRNFKAENTSPLGSSS